MDILQARSTLGTIAEGWSDERVGSLVARLEPLASLAADEAEKFFSFNHQSSGSVSC